MWQLACVPRDDGCFLVDPFAGATVELPALSRVRLRPPNAVAKYTTVEGVMGRLCHPYLTWMHLKDMENVPAIRKLILCSANLVAALVGIEQTSQILVCQPGASSWSVRANDPCNIFEDMAFYQEKLYVLSHFEDLTVMNIGQHPRTGDPQVSRIGKIIRGDQVVLPLDGICRKKLYPVESRGTLLMVRRMVYLREINDMILAGCSEFEVFEADFKHSQWVNVTTLGDDQMLFLGRWCSRAVSASENGMSGDLIFFLDDMQDVRNCAFEDTSVSVYNMRTSKVSSPPPMVWKHQMIPASWLFLWN
ncbi:F-box protein [Panicum miliaceum]|uniref:F-box protein n=1 Tax=Panicum miliaceum TaxID=4540 RepID=A0A3L6T4L8_PANMI|nr:F-box protein [Panicum miliaceum]